MKLAFLAVTVFSAISCGPPTTSPTIYTLLPIWVWAFAVDSSGMCVEGATFEVVGGQGPIGTVVAQQTPCSMWSDTGGVSFEDLARSVPIILRASAAGYTTVEKAVTPLVSGGRAELFWLDRDRP
jgi:hypothetical protein